MVRTAGVVHRAFGVSVGDKVPISILTSDVDPLIKEDKEYPEVSSNLYPTTATTHNTMYQVHVHSGRDRPSNPIQPPNLPLTHTHTPIRTHPYTHIHTQVAEYCAPPSGDQGRPGEDVGGGPRTGTLTPTHTHTHTHTHTQEKERKRERETA